MKWTWNKSWFFGTFYLFMWRSFVKGTSYRQCIAMLSFLEENYLFVFLAPPIGEKGHIRVPQGWTLYLTERNTKMWVKTKLDQQENYATRKSWTIVLNLGFLCLILSEWNQVKANIDMVWMKFQNHKNDDKEEEDYSVEGGMKIAPFLSLTSHPCHRPDPLQYFTRRVCLYCNVYCIYMYHTNWMILFPSWPICL